MGAENAVITIARFKGDPYGVLDQLQTGGSFVLTRHGRFLATVQVVSSEFQAGVLAASSAANGLTIEPIRNTLHSYWDDFVSNLETNLGILRDRRRIALVHLPDNLKLLVVLPLDGDVEAKIVAARFNADGFVVDNGRRGIPVEQLMAETDRH